MSHEEFTTHRPDILLDVDLGENPHPVPERVRQLRHEAKLGDVLGKQFQNGLRALQEEVDAENKDFVPRQLLRLLSLGVDSVAEEGSMLRVFVKSENFSQVREQILMESSRLSGKQDALTTITNHVEGKRAPEPKKEAKNTGEGVIFRNPKL